MIAILLLFLQFTVPMHTGALASSSGSPVLPTANLLAAYQGGSISSSPATSWPDLSSNANFLTSSGASAPVWTASQTPHNNPAVTFDGTDNYFSAHAVIACTSSCTIYFLFKPTAVTAKQSLTSSVAGLALVYAINASAHQAAELQANSVIGTDTTTLTAGTWYRLAFSWDGTNWKFYVNGTLTSSGANAKTISSPIDQIGANISGSSPLEFINGQIGFLAFYSGAYNTAVDTYEATL
jgi:hypothetical protein